MITAQQLRDFAAPVVDHYRTGVAIEPSMWLVLENGDTVVVPGTDHHNYQGITEWPWLLMTGPDPDWFLLWFMDDPMIEGADEWLAARDVALTRARDATDDEWLAACKRAVDEQLGPMAESFFGST